MRESPEGVERDEKVGTSRFSRREREGRGQESIDKRVFDDRYEGSRIVERRRRSERQRRRGNDRVEKSGGGGWWETTSRQSKTSTSFCASASM